MARLKNLNFTAGNKIRYRLDYSEWLEDGSTVDSGTATLAVQDPVITDVTVSAVLIDPTGHLVFFVEGGSVNETFTVEVQATDSRGEIKNDTIYYTVQAP